MATLLYGDRPEADVEPGNRVDTTSGAPGPIVVSPPPMTLPTALGRPHARPFAMRGLVLGLAAASAILAGITVAMIAITWSRSFSPGAQVTLVVAGLMLAAAGIAYVASARTEYATR